MNSDQHIWHNWADTLHRWGLNDLAATFLDASGPLNLLGAQLVYLGQPILNQIVTDGQLHALANVLEDPKQTQAFSAYLRGIDRSE